MKCYNHKDQDAVGNCRYCGKGICKNCAVEVSKQIFCRECAASGPVFSPSQMKKDPTIALLLGLILGLLSFCGIGQIYLGRTKRGFVLFLLGWGILLLNFLGAIFIVGLCVTGPLTLIFFVWQAYDAYRLAQEYNDYFDKNRKAPW